MIELKTPAELDAMRQAGKVVAAALDAVRENAHLGTS
ncbi:MAG TPA: type I methionyl aminopeptidase, partial [Pseudonocardiaceae bacterium]|nr:type I methionyl aminopeptidase [Pseudonocardiaceae bacterium]